MVRVSRYWPPLGGVNCAHFVNGDCLSAVSGCKPWVDDWLGKEKVCGKSWEELKGWVTACPLEWPFGTRVKVLEKEWICVDRGGAIQYVDGIPWVDLMSDTTLVSFGSIRKAQILYP